MRTVVQLLYSRYKAFSDITDGHLVSSNRHVHIFELQSKEMDNVKKGYETRIQQDLLTDAILGKNRIKLYQQHFQVGHELILAYCDIIDRSISLMMELTSSCILVAVMLAGL